MSSGERPIGAAKGKQPNTEALCQPTPPTLASLPCLHIPRLSALSLSPGLQWSFAPCPPAHPSGCGHLHISW